MKDNYEGRLAIEEMCLVQQRSTMLYMKRNTINYSRNATYGPAQARAINLMIAEEAPKS